MAILYFFPSVLTGVFSAQKKNNMAKVANILVVPTVKSKKKNIHITAQWILLKLGQNVLKSKYYKLVLVSRNEFFGDNTVAIDQSVQSSS